MESFAVQVWSGFGYCCDFANDFWSGLKKCYQLILENDYDGGYKYELWLSCALVVIFLAFLLIMALGYFENDQKLQEEVRLKVKKSTDALSQLAQIFAAIDMVKKILKWL